MVNWPAYYDAIYARIGVPSTLTIDDTAMSELPLKVIDKTIGVVVGDGVGVTTIRPACDVRAAEFFGLDLERGDLSNAAISFNAKAWDVMDHEMRPALTGEAEGEIRLFLSEQ